MIEKRHPEWPLIVLKTEHNGLEYANAALRDDVLKGLIKHLGNQLLTMAVNTHVSVKVDNNGMRIDKDKQSNKINPLDALDAYGLVTWNHSDGSGYWTNEKS